MVNLMVVDIYHGDKVTSFAKAHAAGIQGIIHKATTGATGKDPAYAGRRDSVIDAGMLWGAYHWGTHADVGAQVKNFLKHAEPDNKTLVALDFEPFGANTMTLQQAREFLTAIQAELGRKAVIYGGSLLKEQLGNTKDAFFGSHRLWLAQYGPTPKVQKSWETYWLWQYTDGKDGPDPKEVDGIPGNSKGELDCDSYEGTAQKLKAEWAS
jgi:GH25 family lysozyme M1 (1,4-beta-N-acetylmuramidase)